MGIRSICLRCIGDEPARALAATRATLVKCQYCKGRRRGVGVHELSEIIDDAVRTYYGFGGYELKFDSDNDSTYEEPQGDRLHDVLESELEVPYEAAVDLALELMENDPADVADGEEVFYSDTQSYSRIDLPEGEYGERWEEFSTRVTHERRFFDEGARELLEGILGAPKSEQAHALPVMEIGPECRIKAIYRARRADGRKAAEQIMTDPRALERPPKELAIPGRMNAGGIPVFYGAIAEKVALAEVRPSVGSFVITGKFSVRRRLRVLDLSRIDHVFTGSIFHTDYEGRASRLRFLEGFHHLIARPVQPHEETLEYIPTQAVAEYVHNVLGFDGILYGSAQTGGVAAPESGDRPYVELRELTDEELQLFNIVLFGDAGSSVAANDTSGLAFEPAATDSHRVTKVSFDYEWTPVGPGAEHPDLPF